MNKIHPIFPTSKEKADKQFYEFARILIAGMGAFLLMKALRVDEPLSSFYIVLIILGLLAIVYKIKKEGVEKWI